MTGRNVVKTESIGDECFVSATDFAAWIDVQLEDVSLSPSQRDVYLWVRQQIQALDEFQLGQRLMRQFQRDNAKQIIR